MVNDPNMNPVPLLAGTYVTSTKRSKQPHHYASEGKSSFEVEMVLESGGLRSLRSEKKVSAEKR